MEHEGKYVQRLEVLDLLELALQMWAACLDVRNWAGVLCNASAHLKLPSSLSNPLTYTYTLHFLRFMKPYFLLSHVFLLVDWTLKMCLAAFTEKHERKIYLIIYWPQGEAVVFTSLLFTTSWSCDVMVNFMCQFNLPLSRCKCEGVSFS